MPEGHTLHRLARLHRRRFAGHPVAVSSPQGRFAASAKLLDGQVLTGTQAHGKHLFHRYGRDLVVHIHLGLYGTFSDEPRPTAEPGLPVATESGGEPLIATEPGRDRPPAAGSGGELLVVTEPGRDLPPAAVTESDGGLLAADATGGELSAVTGSGLELRAAAESGREVLPPPEPRGLVRMRMVGPTHYADLRGPTTCELITDAEARAIRARLGQDPLRADAEPELVWARISRSRAPLATLLMDQSVISGVGNVYRAEVLFRHGLDPQLPGRALSREQWDALWADLVTLMRDGVRRGRIDTVAPEHDPRLHGAAARKDRHGGEVYAYRRAGQPCLVCATPIAHTEHAARNLFWCPTCQPPAPST